MNITKEKVWSYTVENLFTGSMLLQIKDGMPGQKNNDQEHQKRITRCMQNIVIPFFDHMNPIIEMAISVASGDQGENLIIQALSDIDYNFNANVISNLQAHVRLNARNIINSNTSVIYYVAIVRPDDDAADRTLFYHSFVIEQYYSPVKEATYHRLYQSCQNEMTLNDYFQMKNYGDEDEGCLTYSQIITFLDAVGQILSRNQEPSELLRLSQECFGTQSFGEPPVTFFDTCTKSLNGLSLRYEESVINPSDCKNNIESHIFI